MSDPATLYSPDHKTDPAHLEPHPASSAQFSDSITAEDARYIRKHAADFPPAKSGRDLQPQQGGINIVPDHNPLGHAFVRSATNHRNICVRPDGAIDSHLPGQARHANQEIMGGTWKYGLCDCSEVGICCTGAWCPCIIYGKTQYRLSQRSERKDPTDLLGYSSFNGSCAAYAILCGCNLVLAAIQHSRVRKTYGIPGGVGTDFVRACCCCCCTLSQDEKEVKFRESQARNASTSASTMQYMSPVAMEFSSLPR
jgi:Cys-rich protein (TIGR01571 family)